MTPTEQDKLREQIHSALFADDFPILNDIEKDAVDRVVAIIQQAQKADRKRVALGARIDERQMLSFHRAYGKDYQETLETLEEANDERIAVLKARQEEVDD